MILPFGKYKGKEVKDCPYLYWLWLMNPTLPDGQVFPVPQEIRDEATRCHKAQHYTEWRLAGYVGEKTEYIIERLGDLNGLTLHLSLEEALNTLAMEFPVWTEEERKEWRDNNAGWTIEPRYRNTPDPEDDRILIWEVLPSGHKRVVWHFSGWHWDAEEFPYLEQGSLIGDKDSLYGLAMEDM